MAVALMIGLWLRDELTFNKNFAHYDRIVQVMQHQTFNGVTNTQTANPYLMAEAIREKYGSDFKYIVQSGWNDGYVISHDGKGQTQVGNFFEPAITEILSLEMVAGTRDGLKDINSILLSESSARAFFGDKEALGQILKLNNKMPVKVTGIYKDLPENSDFGNLQFICPGAVPERQSLDRGDGEPMALQLHANICVTGRSCGLATVSQKIRNVKLEKVREEEKAFNAQVFLWPMRNWHLYTDWKDGKNIGGKISSVWLFGIIGVFVLLLACINFMNLSTARSEKRAREVGIRKAVGSHRTQLIMQFFSESTMLAFFGFALSVALVQATLPAFNNVAGKQMAMPFGEPAFWLAGLAIILLTGLLAGSYPALYLSSFQPVKVLKGTFRAGRNAAIPRKALVVLQFTVSVVLIIGTIIVFKQIRHAQNRPVSYNREGLIYTFISTNELRSHYDAIRNEAIASGAVTEVAHASGPPNNVQMINNGYTGKGWRPARRATSRR